MAAATPSPRALARPPSRRVSCLLLLEGYALTLPASCQRLACHGVLLWGQGMLYLAVSDGYVVSLAAPTAWRGSASL